MKRLLTALMLTAACGDDSPGSDVGDTADTQETPDTPDAPEEVDSADAADGADTADSASPDVDPDAQPDTASPDTLDTTGSLDTEVANPDIDEVVDTDDTGPEDTADPSDTTLADTAPDDTSSSDTGPTDTASPDTTPPERVVLIPGFCPSTPTAPGLYRGTLAGNLNDIAGACGASASGRDGAIRVELQPGQTLRATYRHAGDGVLYLLDSCPVVGSCLAGSDDTSSGAESLTFTWTGGAMNPVYLVLDAFELEGPQTFELDLEVTGP